MLPILVICHGASEVPRGSFAEHDAVSNRAWLDLSQLQTMPSRQKIKKIKIKVDIRYINTKTYTLYTLYSECSSLVRKYSKEEKCIDAYRCVQMCIVLSSIKAVLSETMRSDRSKEAVAVQSAEVSTHEKVWKGLHMFTFIYSKLSF